MKKLLTFMLILSLVLLPVSCQKKSDQKQTEPEYTKRDEIEQKLPDEINKLINDGKYSDDINQILEQIKFIDIPLSSYNKIEEAYTLEKIDKKSQVMLTLAAAFSPEDLPEEFKGPRYEGEKKTLKNEFAWLINHKDELDDKTYMAALPFILHPEDPGSYFNPAYDKSKSIFEDLNLLIRVNAADDWTKKDIVIPGVSHSRVTIYYSLSGLSTKQILSIELQVAEIEDAIRYSWPKFMQLLGKSLTKPLDVFLTADLPSGIDGDAVMQYNTKNEAVYTVRISTKKIACGLQSTTAHELFHCFQFEMGLTWYDISPELDWLTEATAVWAESYIYPECNSEHQYLEEFFYYTSHDRFSVEGTREYGSYLLFYFLTEVAGRKSYVADILHAAAGVKESMDVRGAMANVIEDIKEVYGRFAICNWNMDPYKVYKDTPKFPSVPAYGESGRVVRYISKDSDNSLLGQWANDGMIYLETIKPGIEECKEIIAPGGIKYIVYMFDDTKIEEIEKIRFDFSDEEGQNDIKWMKRQAFVKIKDKWLERSQDWTDKDEVEFCRKKDDEYVTALVLILSNAGLGANDSANLTYKVDTRDKCTDLKGYVKASIDAIYEEGGDSISINTLYYSKDELLYCSDCDRYVFKNRNISYDDTYFVKYLNPYLAAVGTTKYENISSKFSGTLYEEYSDEDKIERLRISDDNKKITIIFSPPTKSTDWIDVSLNNTFTQQDERSSDNEPGLLIGSILRGRLDFLVGSNTYSSPMGMVYDECEITDEHISGIRKITTAQGAVILLEFKYEIKSKLTGSK